MTPDHHWREKYDKRRRRKMVEAATLECMRRHDPKDSRFGYTMRFLADNTGYGFYETRKSVVRLLRSCDITRKGRGYYVLKDNGWGRLCQIDAGKRFNHATGRRE